MKRFVLAAVVTSVAFISVPAFAQGKGKGKKELVVQTMEDIKWNPMDPKQPEGVAIAVLEGDPMKGAATYYLRIPKGPSGIHMHTADYRATVVKGTHKHWAEGKEADAKPLTVGSSWFQPGKAMHGDECVADQCVLFIAGAGKFDYVPSKTQPTTGAMMKADDKGMKANANANMKATDAAVKADVKADVKTPPTK